MISDTSPTRVHAIFRLQKHPSHTSFFLWYLLTCKFIFLFIDFQKGGFVKPTPPSAPTKPFLSKILSKPSFGWWLCDKIKKKKQKNTTIVKFDTKIKRTRSLQLSKNYSFLASPSTSSYAMRYLWILLKLHINVDSAARINWQSFSLFDYSHCLTWARLQQHCLIHISSLTKL